MATHYGWPEDNLRAEQMVAEWRRSREEKQRAEAEEKLTISVQEFKDFIYNLIEEKGGALPDFDDWKEIKTRLDRLEETANDPMIPRSLPFGEIRDDRLDKWNQELWHNPWEQKQEVWYAPIEPPKFGDWDYNYSAHWNSVKPSSILGESQDWSAAVEQGECESALLSTKGVTPHMLDHSGTRVTTNRN